MTQGTNLKINVLVLDDASKKAKSKKVLVDFNLIQSLEGHNSLLSTVSKEFKMEITKKHFEIELLHMGKWINLVDLNSFLFFISSNILTDQETKLRITYKSNWQKEIYEDEDMIKANQLDMAIYKDKKNIVKCGICHQTSINEFFIHRLGPFYGPFKQGDQKYYIHLICALWCPQVCISKSNRLINVAKEIHRSKREKCSYCGDTGAALGCWLVAEDTCKKQYHYLCAISDGCFFNKKAYGILCPKHKDDYDIPDPDIEEGVCYYKKESKNMGVEETFVCSICLLTCDQDLFLQCTKCHKFFHSYCADYKIIEDEGSVRDQDYVCSKCTIKISIKDN